MTDVHTITTVGDLAVRMAKRAGELSRHNVTFLRLHVASLMGQQDADTTLRKAECIEAILKAEFDITAPEQELDVPVMFVRE